jgi:hypothetical protein
MVAKKTTTTKKTTTPKKIKLAFKPLITQPSALQMCLEAHEIQNIDGRETAVVVPKIKGLPTTLIVENGETIEVTKTQCDQLTELGFVETTEEAKKRQEFVDNLGAQHPDKLSYGQLTGDAAGMLTSRDINYISTFKLTKI